MIVDVIMPKMGESINEGTILEWRIKVGDVIQLDEILLEIGTDKVDSVIPSSAAGIILEILAEPNDIKEVGEVIARIDTNTDTAGESTLSNNIEKEVIILRGVPGIGKNSFIYDNEYSKQGGFSHVSSDEYFYKNGKYKFDRKSIDRSNAYCFD